MQNNIESLIYGYYCESGSGTGSVNLGEGEVVQGIFQMSLSGVSPGLIAKALGDRGIGTEPPFGAKGVSEVLLRWT